MDMEKDVQYTNVNGYLRVTMCCAALLLLAGCVSASLEDAAPKPEAPSAVPKTKPVAGSGAQEATTAGDNSFVADGARRNDDFPTFAQTPVGATDQLSDSAKQAILDEMASIRAAHQSSGNQAAAYSTRYNNLQELAKTHGVETQAEIEN